MKKTLTFLVAAGLMMSGTTAFALTLDKARADIDRHVAEKKLDAKDHSEATATLQRLVDKGVPVDHAYRVVEASVDNGVKGRDLAEVSGAIESTGPGARKEAADVATNAIRNRYTARETVEMTNTFGKTVASGAPAGTTSRVMSNGINKRLESGKINAAMNTYAGEIGAGTPPDTAAGNATRSMDRDRTMLHDRDMTRDRDHMGSGTGMNNDMNRGSGMGAGPGMGGGGPRR